MEREFDGKTILIGVPNYVSLPERFKENLQFLGFKVIILEQDTSEVTIPTKDALIHIYKKFVLKDKTHKITVRNEIKEGKQLEFLSKIKENIDFALFIRPDLFSLNVVKKVKSLSNKTVAYQWDGISRYPIVNKYLDLFDKFFVFDADDLKLHLNFNFTTNFYFDDLINSKADCEKNSIFFVGSAMKDRLGVLNKIGLNLKKFGLIPNFFIYNFGRNKLDGNKYNNFKLILEPLSFKDSILKMQKSEFLLDMYNPAHNGLSFRVFESVGYKKKLITNNALVKKYDLYHPNNIFVFNGEDFSGLKQFVNSPYELLEKEIYEKYSFTNWIKNILR